MSSQGQMYYYTGLPPAFPAPKIFYTMSCTQIRIFRSNLNIWIFKPSQNLLAFPSVLLVLYWWDSCRSSIMDSLQYRCALTSQTLLNVCLCQLGPLNVDVPLSIADLMHLAISSMLLEVLPQVHTMQFYAIHLDSRVLPTCSLFGSFTKTFYSLMFNLDLIF